MICEKCEALSALIDGYRRERNEAQARVIDAALIHAELVRERDEARAEVEHWRVKATAYGGMVHGCGQALEAAGHPIDPFQPDGRVGGIALSVAALIKERDEAREAYADARASRWHIIKERNAFMDEVDRLSESAKAAWDAECFMRNERDEARASVADAYRRGAEAMREACAQWVDHWVSGHVADKLRDMPIPEEP